MKVNSNVPCLTATRSARPESLKDPREIGDSICSGAAKAARDVADFGEATSQLVGQVGRAAWHAGGQFVAGAIPLAGAASLVQGVTYSEKRTNAQRWAGVGGAMLNLAGTAALLSEPATGCALLGVAGLISSNLKPDQCFGTDWAKGTVPLAGPVRNFAFQKDDGDPLLPIEDILKLGGAVLGTGIGCTIALEALRQGPSVCNIASTLVCFSAAGALSAWGRVPEDVVT